MKDTTEIDKLENMKNIHNMKEKDPMYARFEEIDELENNVNEIAKDLRKDVPNIYIEFKCSDPFGNKICVIASQKESDNANMAIAVIAINSGLVDKYTLSERESYFRDGEHTVIAKFIRNK